MRQAPPSDKRPKRSKRSFGWLIALLALVCVLGAELAVCRVAEPALYARLTAPVRAAAHTVLDTARAALDQAAEAFRAFSHRLREAAASNQQATEPALPTDQPAEDPRVTAFVRQGDREVLTGGTVPLVYFNQGEDPWKDSPYGPDPIGGYGCGPTAMAMVVSTLTDRAADPARMANWAAGEGYCAPGSGSYHSLVQGAAEAYGLSLLPRQDWQGDQLLQALSTGCLFVALMGPGHFTNSGHFIVLRGVTMDGRVLVADPNSRQRSLVAWDPQLLVDELSASTDSGGPLWAFPVPVGA